MTTGLDDQSEKESEFQAGYSLKGGASSAGAETDAADYFPPATRNWAVLEIGAGVVVPSIRRMAHEEGNESDCFIRVNPSADECRDVGSFFLGSPSTRIEGRLCSSNYFPLQARSEAALAALSDELSLP